MSNLSIDLTTLTEEQLTAMVLVAPAAVKEEQLRRRSYASMADAMTALRLAQFKLDTFIESIRKTQSVKAVIETGIQNTLERFLLTAQINGMAMGEGPIVPEVVEKAA